MPIPDLLAALNALRGYPSGSNSSEIWSSFFYNWESENAIVVEAEGFARHEAKHEKYNLRISPITVSDAQNGFRYPVSPTGNEPTLQTSLPAVVENTDSLKQVSGLNFIYDLKDSTDPKQKINVPVISLAPNQGGFADLQSIKKLPAAFLPSRGIHNPQSEALRYSKLEIERRTGEVLSVLQTLDPRIKNLHLLATEKEPRIGFYADIGDPHLMPLALMGDGMLRILSIALSMATTRGGLVLVDEIESGLYYSSLPKVWSMLSQTARKLDIQVFATTHSEECIRSAHNALTNIENLNDLRIYRFDLIDGHTRAVYYSPEEISAAIETDIEVR